MANSHNVRLNFFETLKEEDITKKLSYLRKVLPKKCTKNNYQLTNKLLKINRWGVNESNLQSNLQEVADRMRVHLKIKKPIKILTINNVDAGKFERIGNLNCIYVNGNLDGQNYSQKLAILAHEMSHFHLIYEHNIHLPVLEENELLTEINAVYVGFGFLLLKGYLNYNRMVGTNKKIISRVGYIKPEIVKDTIVKTAYLRKQNPIWIIKNGGLFNIPYFSIQLFELAKQYRKALKKRNKNNLSI